MEWRRFVTYLWNDPRTLLRSVTVIQSLAHCDMQIPNPTWSLMLYTVII